MLLRPDWRGHNTAWQQANGGLPLSTRYPCRVVGSFAFLGVNGNLMCVPLACMGHMRHTHARNKGGWHHASASPKFQPALDRPPASPSQLLPDNLTTPAFPGSLFHPSFRPNHTRFASADFFATHGCLVLPFGVLQALLFLVALPLLRHLPDQGKVPLLSELPHVDCDRCCARFSKHNPFLSSPPTSPRKYHRNLIPPTPSPVP